MHRRVLEEAKPESLRSFLSCYFDKMGEEEKDEAEMLLYHEVYGPHFNEWLLEEAVAKLDNEDGSRGAKWTLQESDSVAKAIGVKFDRFNRYDWNYVLNMVYSDYYGSVSDDTASYGRLARAFINDKDAPEGKAIIYYESMKC